MFELKRRLDEFLLDQKAGKALRHLNTGYSGEYRDYYAKHITEKPRHYLHNGQRVTMTPIVTLESEEVYGLRASFTVFQAYNFLKELIGYGLNDRQSATTLVAVCQGPLEFTVDQIGNAGGIFIEDVPYSLSLAELKLPENNIHRYAAMFFRSKAMTPTSPSIGLGDNNYLLSLKPLHLSRTYLLNT